MFFDVLNLRVVREVVSGRLLVGCYFDIDYLSLSDTKETKKSLPENSKLKNIPQTPFRSPSHSPFRLNSRTTATCFIVVLTF
jgi:hypothetical protein